MGCLEDLFVCDLADAYVITSSANRFYYLGFESTCGYLVLSGDRKFFLTDARYGEDARASIEGIEVVEFTSAPYDELARILGNPLRIGIEDKSISLAEYRALKSVFPEAEFVGISDKIADLRAVKTSEEIEKITRAAEIADKSFSQLLRKIKNGVSEKELAAELDYLLRSNGADGNSFDTIIAFGSNTSKPHSHPTDKKLEKGNLILMDFGCVVDGYCSDMTRTMAYGDLSKEMRARYSCLLSAQQFALGAIRAGITGREADALAREYLKSHGLDGFFLHSLGHGVGVEIHEEPYLSPRSETILAENMVITVEPGIYFADEGGIRIEDLAVVTESGLSVLSQSQKELIII